jgi:hypothetical protein
MPLLLRRHHATAKALMASHEGECHRRIIDERAIDSYPTPKSPTPTTMRQVAARTRRAHRHSAVKSVFCKGGLLEILVRQN